MNIFLDVVAQLRCPSFSNNHPARIQLLFLGECKMQRLSIKNVIMLGFCNYYIHSMCNTFTLDWYCMSVIEWNLRDKGKKTPPPPPPPTLCAHPPCVPSSWYFEIKNSFHHSSVQFWLKPHSVRLMLTSYILHLSVALKRYIRLAR